MGVDTRIYLPGTTLLKDAADVIGIAAGLTFKRRSLGSVRGGSWYLSVPGVKFGVLETLPQCVEILLDGPMVDGSIKRIILWHWEGGHGSDRLLMPRSTRFWREIGRTLVHFFGGTLDLCDCDYQYEDLVVPNQYPDGMPKDSDAWQDLQEKKANVKPITL